MRRRKTRLSLTLAFTILALILGALMLQKYRDSHKLPSAPIQPRQDGLVRISLFFAAPDGNGLVREAAEIDACGNDLPSCIQETLEKLVDGPMGDLAPTLPDATVVNDVQVQDDTAILNFGKELAEGVPGGSSAETTAIYSIVNTISLNFPQIKKVKFLQDGHDMDTLKGHLDLRRALGPDFGLEKSSVAPSKAGYTTKGQDQPELNPGG